MDGYMPPMPPERHEVVITQCIEQAAADYKLNPDLLRAIRQVEGGKVGMRSRNTNGTYDLGPMQINNGVWVPTFKAFGISERDLQNDPCVNVYAATWILRNEIARADGDVWRGVGNYHSRTPRFHVRYRDKVKAAFARIASRFTGDRRVAQAN